MQKEQRVIFSGIASSADLGGSSDYSNEMDYMRSFED